jgi:hypothetical protein
MGLSNVSSLAVIIPVNLLLFYSLLKKTKLTFSKDMSIILVCISLYLVYGFFHNAYFDNVLTSGLFWWLVIFVFLLLLPKVDIKTFKLASIVYIVSSILVLSYDAYYRIVLNPVTKAYGEDIGRYAYKIGIIDMDSNFAGYFALSVFCLCFYLSNRLGIKTGIYKLILFPLVLLSLSISAISAMFISFALLIVVRLKLHTRLLIVLFGVVLFVFVIDMIQGAILSDGSGSSKIFLITQGLEQYSYGNLSSLLFGEGLNKAKVGTFDPHILILKLLLELGLIGLILFLSIFASLYLVFNFQSLYVIFPYFIVGLSVVSLSTPVLTSAILIVYLGERCFYAKS